MKKIFILAIAALSLTSCRLDLKPDSDLTYNGYWDTEEAVRANRVGIYAKFRDYAYTLWRMGEVRSDIWNGKTIETAYDELLIVNDITATKVPYTGWASLYTMIHYVNDYIKNEATAPGTGSAERNRMLGEVYGIRAYLYFTLLKNWGDVPIVTEPLTGALDAETRNKKREPKAKVAEFIKSDIQKSLDLFGSNSSLYNGKNIYWSKPATLALKGEAYLWFANVLNTGNADLVEAKNALTQITGFSLVPEFKNLWGVTKENNSEFIFAFDYQVNQATHFLNGVLTGRKIDVAAYYDKNGNSLSDFVVSGGNRYGINDKIINIFENDPEDLRAESTFMLMYANNNGGAGYPHYNPANYKATMWLKFLGDVEDGSRNSYTNMPMYRYADVLLMLAEAKNKLGEDPSSEINQIRKRAYGANYNNHIYTNSSVDANTKAILDERLREFLGEGKRWWDLMRAGGNYIFQEVPSLNQAPISGNPKKLYLPISQGMIDADPNNMTQTDGY